MIKFFRKFRQKLLTENEFSKYLLYAIGEIILVVIGILIALQINNWNENRKEASYEQKVLKELKSDFLFNKKELNDNIEQAGRLAQNGDSLIAIFSLPKEEADLNKVWNFTRRLYGYSTFDPSNGALNNLISSGNLNIVKNDSLRMHLSRWYGMLQDVKEDETRLIQYGDTWLEPIYLEYVNPGSDGAKINPTLLENQKFENIVKTMRNRANYIVKIYGILNLEIDRILDGIEGELNAPSR